MKWEQFTPGNEVKDAVRNSMKLSTDTQRIPTALRSKCYDNNNKDIDPNANNVNNDSSS